MKYDFTTILDRVGHDATALDNPNNGVPPFDAVQREEGFDIIPMWVADMNFPIFPGIQEAMINRINHPSFGYYSPSEEYYEKIIDWQKRRNGITDIKPENIGYENGVLGGVISAMRVLASQGDNVLVHSPTYVGFTYVLENNGYHMIHSPLVLDEKNVWRMDFKDMEEKIQQYNIHTLILANPYNPTGRVWTKEELEELAKLCEKYSVYIISDEIWSDILLDGHKHTPTHSINEYTKKHTVTYYSFSKTFSLAGLVGSYRIVYDSWLKDRLNKETSLSHYNAMNVLSMHALIGAYSNEGHEWIDELKEVLSKNVEYGYNYILEHFEGVHVAKPEGTYMLFINCKEYCDKHNMTHEELLHKAWKVGVYWQDGNQFNDPDSMRLNLALPMSRLEEAFERLDKYVFNGSL